MYVCVRTKNNPERENGETMKDAYSILGLDKSASKEELEAKYKELKAIYSEGRFLSGAEGMKAARNLNDLENAWLDICEDLRARELAGRISSQSESTQKVGETESTEEKIELKAEEVKTESSEKDALAYADTLIKEKKFDDAQRVLDNISDRNAEWHYLQARVYYNREWIAECKKHLEIAIASDPTNEKYKNTLDKINHIIGDKNANPENLHADDQRHEQYDQQNMSAGNSLLNCCSTYCLMSLCCDMCCRC